MCSVCVCALQIGIQMKGENDGKLSVFLFVLFSLFHETSIPFAALTCE